MRPSLRDRKKAATRLAISDTATRLFHERGYESVTLAEVAEAADVSVKTIFNYFNTKEELFFDRAHQVLEALTAEVTGRPAGVTVLGALHALLADQRMPFSRDGWRSIDVAEGYERYRAFVAVEQAAPALRARRLVIADEWVLELAPVLAAELALEPDDLRARAMATMIIAVMSLRGSVLTAAVMERVAPEEVERRTRAVVDDAFERLRRAFDDLDRPS